MNITFIVNLYKEPIELVNRLDTDLKRFYPESKILYLSDGPEAITFGNGVSFDERLKIPGHSNRWVHRYMKTYLDNSDSSHVIKIDPDAELVNRMVDETFGDVFVTKVFLPLSTQKAYIPHAGVIGFSREYVKKVLDICLKPAYAEAKIHGSREELIYARLFRETNANVIDRMDFCCGPKRLKECQFVSFKHK